MTQQELTFLLMFIASKVQAYRKFRGFTQSQIADYLKISESAYVRREQAKQRFFFDEIIKLSKKLETPITTFIPTEEDLKLLKSKNSVK